MNETYEPELGQMIFGNEAGEFDLGAAEDMVANELYALSETLGKRDPDAQHHGLLGGEWGYGQDFKNAVFEMHSYWWGDCECGFEQAEYEWDEAHQHTTDCWHTRWHGESERLHALGLKYGEERERLDAWARENGWDGRPGVAVFCDCGIAAQWHEWRSAHDHDPDCGVARPNFRCGDVEVRWYKYIGRGMSVNRSVTHAGWRGIFSRCMESLRQDAAPGFSASSAQAEASGEGNESGTGAA